MQEVFALEDVLLQQSSRKANVPKPHTWGQSFTLENGAAQLQRHFPEVQIRRYPDGLRVTQAEPLVAYIISMLGVSQTSLTEQAVQAFSQQIEARIQVEGAIHITKDSGLFRAVKPV